MRIKSGQALRSSGLAGAVQGGGQKVGTLVYSNVSPGPNWLEIPQSSTTQFASASYPKFIKETKIWSLNQVLRDNADTDSSLVYYYSASYNDNVYWLNTYAGNPLVLMRKTAAVNTITEVSNISTGADITDSRFIGFTSNGICCIQIVSGFNKLAYSSPPYTSWSFITSFNATYKDVLWTGSRYIIATSSGIRTATSLGGALSTPTSSGAGSDSAQSANWTKLWKVDGVIYAISINNKWTKSTDDGLTWTNYEAPTNGPWGSYQGAHYVQITPTYGFFLGVGLSSNQYIYNAGDPTTPWTDVPTANSANGGGGTYGFKPFYRPELGGLFLFQPNGTGMIYLNQNGSINSYRSLGQHFSGAVNKPAWSVHAIGGRMIYTEHGDRWKILQIPSEVFNFQSMGQAVKGRRPFIKVA